MDDPFLKHSPNTYDKGTINFIGNGRVIAINVTLLTVFALGVVLRLTRQIFLPFFIALLLSYAVAPIIAFLTKRKVSHIIAIIVVLILLMVISFLVSLILFSSIRSLTANYAFYQERFVTLISSLIQRYNIPDTAVNDLINFFDPSIIANIVLSLSGSFVTFGQYLILVILFMFFLLLEHKYIRRKLALAFNRKTNRQINNVLVDINRQIGAYLSIKIAISLMTGILVYIVFLLIGVDFPFIWGTLAFLFNFIPSVGSIIISLISSLFVIIQFLPNWLPIIAAITSILVIQIIMGNLIEPHLLGERLNISPVLLIISLLIWGTVWGFAGMFLSVPLAVALKIVLLGIPATRFLGILMGSKPNIKSYTRKTKISTRQSV